VVATALTRTLVSRKNPHETGEDVLIGQETPGFGKGHDPLSDLFKLFEPELALRASRAIVAPIFP